jgi:hypothetical protein
MRNYSWALIRIRWSRMRERIHDGVLWSQWIVFLNASAFNVMWGGSFMAHKGTGTKVGRRYTVRGMSTPTVGSPAPISFEVDGHLTEMGGVRATNHVADCLAAICVMIDADGHGVTDLTIECNSELLRNHANELWRRRDLLLKEMHISLQCLELRFDDVHWV